MLATSPFPAKPQQLPPSHQQGSHTERQRPHAYPVRDCGARILRRVVCSRRCGVITRVVAAGRAGGDGRGISDRDAGLLAGVLGCVEELCRRDIY